MPQKIFCDECGFVFYEGAELKSPDEIIQKNDGKCPSCGKKLSSVPIDVDVKPAE